MAAGVADAAADIRAPSVSQEKVSRRRRRAAAVPVVVDAAVPLVRQLVLAEPAHPLVPVRRVAVAYRRRVRPVRPERLRLLVPERPAPVAKAVV